MVTKKTTTKKNTTKVTKKSEAKTEAQKVNKAIKEKKSLNSKTKKTVSKIGKVANINYYGTGRRKCSIARVWIFEGSGECFFNENKIEKYSSNPLIINAIKKPLMVLNLDKKYDVVIKAKGGGSTGQIEASRLGIARALVSMNVEFRKSLKEQGLLTRDDRIKERKKYGKRGARKGPQYRKR